MIADVLQSSLNELGKSDKTCKAFQAFYHFFAMDLICWIIHGHEC